MHPLFFHSFYFSFVKKKQFHITSYIFHPHFSHPLLLTSFQSVQTSVAVISPSRAKSVCSLSVCFHTQTKSIPSGEQEKKDKNPTCKTIENTTTTFLVHHKWNKWKCTGVSVSYRLSVNTHTHKRKIKPTKRDQKQM